MTPLTLDDIDPTDVTSAALAYIESHCRISEARICEDFFDEAGNQIRLTKSERKFEQGHLSGLRQAQAYLTCGEPMKIEGGILQCLQNDTIECKCGRVVPLDSEGNPYRHNHTPTMGFYA